MKVAWKVALSTLLLLCIGTGRATWIDSVAVIDAVSEPEPSQDRRCRALVPPWSRPRAFSEVQADAQDGSQDS